METLRNLQRFSNASQGTAAADVVERTVSFVSHAPSPDCHLTVVLVVLVTVAVVR